MPAEVFADAAHVSGSRLESVLHAVPEVLDLVEQLVVFGVHVVAHHPRVGVLHLVLDGRSRF
ncbi:hypothetical protein ACFPRL_30610 [Pseudoclavibacter helvolus]